MALRSWTNSAATLLVVLALSPAIASAKVASFTPLGGLPGSPYAAIPDAVSADGTVVVGSASTPAGEEAFAWDAVGGIRGLGDLPGGIFSSHASDVSSNGSTIVGIGSSANGQRAFVWDAAGGMRALGTLAGYESYRSSASAVSDDGTRIVGGVFELFDSHAFLWTPSTGMQPIAALPPGRTGVQNISGDGSTLIGHAPFSPSLLLPYIWDATNGLRWFPTLSGDGHLDRPNALSSDGRSVVGAAESPEGTEAFVWDAVGGIRGLGDLPGGPFFSEATAISADGSVIVGHSGTVEIQEAFIWDPVLGMNSLEVVLAARRIDLTGWKLEWAHDLSSDGRTIVGSAIDPQGHSVGYVAYLPEPDGAVGLFAGSAALAIGFLRKAATRTAPRGRTGRRTTQGAPMLGRGWIVELGRWISGSFLGLLLVGGILGFADPASAREPYRRDPFDNPGSYVQVGGSFAYNFFDAQIEKFLEDELGEEGNVDIGESGGINARVGYRAASWFAAELEYEWINRYDVEVGGNFGPGGGALSGKLYDIEGHTLTLNTRWIVPIWRIQPYLLLGAGYSHSDLNRGPTAGPLEAQDADIEIEDGGREAFAGRAGIGVDFHLTEHFVLQTEATALYTTQDFDTPDEGAIDDLYYLSLSAGLQYRF